MTQSILFLPFSDFRSGLLDLSTPGGSPEQVFRKPFPPAKGKISEIDKENFCPNNNNNNPKSSRQSPQKQIPSDLLKGGELLFGK